MQKHNVTNPCLLNEKLDKEIINITLPPEYHLYEYPVSEINDLSLLIKL